MLVLQEASRKFKIGSINFQHYTCILSEVSKQWSAIRTDLFSAFHKRMRLFCFIHLIDKMGNGDV